jgi:DNA invertase Pin-like site-specific DNA recombinase
MKRQRRQTPYTSHLPLERVSGAPEPMVAWVRHPIRQLVSRVLLILIYARYSTDEQNPQSIDAQINYCTQFLRALGITDYNVEVIQDVELSGELRNRPGIDEVWRGIEERRWDLIFVEDASRLYRHESWAVDLVGKAFDKEIRTICINDRVDTAEPVEDWTRRLRDATRTHADRNWYTSHQIKRAHEYLWSIGAAIGPLRSGYRRRPTKPATKKDPAEGPFYDEIDERLAPAIHAAFEQAAASDPTWKISEYLTKEKVPKTSNSKREEWSERNVISLIRETIYRGWDVFRETHSTPERHTGKKKPKRSDASQKLTRPMPHLQIVNDEIWYQANAAIDARRTCKHRLSGPDHPLFGVPRDSRTLLATLFKCAVCGGPMVKGGRRGNAYFCSAVRKRECWNRAGADYEITKNAVLQVVREQLCAADAVVDNFLARLERLIGDREVLSQRVATLSERKQNLKLKIRRLIASIENQKCPSAAILERIEKREGLLRKTTAKLKQLRRLLSGTMIPTRADVVGRLQKVMTDLEAANPKTAGVALRKVVRRIDAVPFGQFNSSVVVLRGRIVVDLAKLLSVELASVLAELHGDGLVKEFAPTTVIVDLFEPSTGPAFGLKAEALAREQGQTEDQVATNLGLTKHPARCAIKYGRALREAGIEDPYLELTEPPIKAAHWGPHKRSRSQGGRKPRPKSAAPPNAPSK